MTTLFLLFGGKEIVCLCFSVSSDSIPFSRLRLAHPAGAHLRYPWTMPRLTWKESRYLGYIVQYRHKRKDRRRRDAGRGSERSRKGRRTLPVISASLSYPEVKCSNDN